jgi:tRNA uridine 5-carbamoylmethylation protein Kti12
LTKKGAFIILSGADGSGKTTVAKFLVSVLSNRGSVCFHWFRGSHLFAFWQDFSRVKSFRGGCNPYYMI